MKWFRVAVEGATTDGRKMSRQWIEQMAKNFNPTVYGARIWQEHIRGLFHDGPFTALGDVKAVKAEEITEGPLTGKLALYVQLDPTDELKEINGKRQKIYSSIEVDPEFADTGEAYLIGMAVTDSPASLGTEMLQFSAQQGSKSPLANRKQRPENLFTAAVEIDLAELFTEQDPASEDPKSSGPSLLDSVKALFARMGDKAKGDITAFRADLEKTLGLFVEKHSDLEKKFTSSEAAFNSLKTEHEALKKRFDDLYTRLDNDPDQPNRSPATGGETVELTDC
ncbi:MAG: GPO family capsid scaffolding protein [Moraxellaceae bacterium]|nr:GPO family capsid scaffolding protein [Moraxellaceae bacterium]